MRFTMDSLNQIGAYLLDPITWRSCVAADIRGWYREPCSVRCDFLLCMIRISNRARLWNMRMVLQMMGATTAFWRAV
jgi:hypothetical protein